MLQTDQGPSGRYNDHVEILPAPHPPAIYDRRQHRYTAPEEVGYLDSIALADEALGVLRHAIEAVGLWQHTALLVSAGHGWRRYHWRGSPEWTIEDEAASRQNTVGCSIPVKTAGPGGGRSL